MANLIKYKKSVIPACDVSTLEDLRKLVSETCKVKGIGGYKVGFELALPYGLKNVVRVIREITDLPIIYDHQKGGTDIHELGEQFVKACKDVDAIILFPTAGPLTEKEWINAAFKAGMEVIIGGEMTHPQYLAKDGGYIADDAPQRIYELAASMGVRNFVIPGNKIDRVKYYKQLIESKGISPIFYSPGLIAQGGDITEAARIIKEHWHAIIGRGIYQAKDMKKAAEEYTRMLR
ncbi:orotidine 5'-phosphate decarboxylase [Candidatus Woesearchaeota archaeon]|nr:orotidine 5'-phosphate decarboxylase [Candidatus Woesearchaeota archaeon]